MDRIPAAARPHLDSYCARLRDELGSDLVAIYLHGSIALDAFDARTSDIDVLVVSRRTATAPTPRMIDARITSEVGSVSPTARKIACEHGIVLFGPLPAEVIPPPTAEELRAEMIYNLHVYWRARAKRVDLHFFDRGVDFAVQTIPRILHTLETGTIISKPTAVAHLRQRFPEWRALTEPSWRRLSRSLSTRRFILSMIAHADRAFDL